MNVRKSTMVDSEQIPERQLRPLSKLQPDQQREAWQKAVETAPDSLRFAGQVMRSTIQTKVACFRGRSSLLGQI